MFDIEKLDEFDRHVMKEAQKSSDPESAIALYKLMSDLSEEGWSAGWLTGNEFNLWEIVLENKPCNYGQNEINQETIDRLRDLSSKCGGWWYWNDDNKFGEEFVNPRKWKILYSQLQILLGGFEKSETTVIEQEEEDSDAS